MSSVPVTHYRISWNPYEKKGYIEIGLRGANEPTKVPVEDATELAALSAVLRESPVFMQDDGLIYTGWEPTD